MKIYVCKRCKKEFTPIHHGMNRPLYCSRECANIDTIEQRRKKFEEKRKSRPVLKRICRQCNKEYEHNRHFSISQWQKRKYCSLKCSQQGKIINDGMSNMERYRRKKGVLKKGTEEWLEKIKATTTEAMNKPEVKDKMKWERTPMTDEVKGKISTALMGKMPRNMIYGSSAYPNVHRGDYSINGVEYYFRSRWEANYALFLDFLIAQKQVMKWEYEPDTFIFEQIKFGTRSYRPDFKVTNINGSIEYHEVKGYMDSKSKTKLKRMGKYYPDIKIILIDGKFYNELKKKLGKVLNFFA